MEILKIEWETGYMELNVKAFFPCKLQSAKMIAPLINRYCAEENRVALLSELHDIVEFYQQEIQEDKDAHERLRRHCESMGSMKKPEELKAMKCCETKIRKAETLKKRAERNIDLIEGGEEKVNKYNSEGYYDPVTYEALRRVAAGEKKAKKIPDFRTFDGFRPLVYICSPYAGDTVQNTKNARRYSRFALERNTIPLTPHLLYPQFMVDSDPAERRLAQHKINYVLVGKCDELWVFGGVLSSGMEREISVAERRNMRIRYFTDDLKEVIR